MTVRTSLTDGLLAVLRRTIGDEHSSFASPPEPLTGGFWAELVRFRLDDPPAGWDGDLVARVMPDPATAAKETAFQAEVAVQGFPTPAVLAAGGPEAGIDGRAYLVMPLAPGRPLLAGLDGLGALARLPSLARRLPVTLAVIQADLHRLDPGPVRDRLEAAGLPVPGIESMLDHLRETATALRRSDLEMAARWLQDHPPGSAAAVVCHGDLHPFNVLVEDSGTATVLDWSAAVLAPPAYDLGFTSLLLAQPPLVAPGPLRPVVAAAGRALSRRFVRAYERASGVAIDDGSLAWHQSLVCLRALVEVAGWEAAGSLDDRGGHPWVIAGEAFAARLAALTGAPVVSRTSARQPGDPTPR